ncbi:MAG: EAL domain-containing protein [Gammaproteobacteria bacterium]|nr:EAL domain-containing protein [Gammaproteobacteria bacterium]
MKRFSPSTFIGSLIFLLGFFCLTGWINHIPFLIRPSFSAANMVFNTALCFSFVGIAIFTLSIWPERRKMICLLTAIPTLLIASLVLLEYILDMSLFNLDQVFVNAWLPDQNPYPGRMAINTAIAFFMTSITFLLFLFAEKKYIAYLIEIMILATLFSGLFAILGYFLKIEFLYAWYQYTRMATHTAIAFVLTAFGLWSIWRNTPGYGNLHSMRDSHAIIRVSATILVATAAVAGFSGYAIGLNPDESMRQFYIAFPIMLMTISAGVLLLYWLVLPLVRQSALELSYQAFHDTLTGLVNRNQLEQSIDLSIASAFRSQQKFAIFFLDIDHFKKINDTLGHDAGDQLLRIVGERLSKSIRKTDIAARLGGDEFILVLHGADTPEIAAVFAEKIINALIKPIKILEHEIIVTASLGISFYPEDGDDFKSLIKSADLALYKAKQSGRNNYQFCTLEMNKEINEKLLMKNALQTALDNQEFYLVFQPKIDLIKNRVIGFEALLRWESLTYGNVPPNRIIPLTEEMGLINQLGDWIAKKAMTQLHVWHANNLSDISIALNIATRHFLQPTFAKNLLSIIEQTKLSGRYLELEISESLIMQNPEYSLGVIKELKKSGVRITIDNFGTGYSSIQHLHNFQVDCIKIDRRFIADIPQNKAHVDLLHTLISLAKSLHVEVIAEGVETKEQFTQLIEMGCDEVQGYYISKPMPAAEVESFMQKFAAKMKQLQHS